MSIDEMACRLMGTERQVAVARELALKVKRALREQVGECLTCSIGIAPNVFLGKVGSDLQKPDGLVVITHDDLPEILLGLELQEIYGIGERMEAAAAPRRHLHRRRALAGLADAPAPRLGRHQRLAVPSDAARRRYPAPLLPLRQKHGPSARARAGIAHQRRCREFRPAPADQGGRAAAARRLFLPPPRPAPVMDRRSRRLVGRGQFQRDPRHRLSARLSRPALAAGAALQAAVASASCCSISCPPARTSRIYSMPPTRGARNCRR